MGKCGNRLNMKGCKIDITDPTNKKGIIKIIDSYKTLLEEKMNHYISDKKNTDLYNIRDEILSDLNQFTYLLTLN